jgi:transcriptional regulator NrdR family protein
MHCPRCRKARLVEITLTVQGASVRMRSCSTCDTRWWDREGEAIDLAGVLDLATVQR